MSLSSDSSDNDDDCTPLSQGASLPSATSFARHRVLASDSDSEQQDDEAITTMDHDDGSTAPSSHTPTKQRHAFASPPLSPDLSDVASTTNTRTPIRNNMSGNSQLLAPDDLSSPPLSPTLDLDNDATLPFDPTRASIGTKQPTTLQATAAVNALDEVEQTVIWGTNINVNDTMMRFEYFINHCKDDDASDELVYPTLIRQAIDNATHRINLDCRHLQHYDATLYQQLVCYPQEIITLFDIAINKYAHIRTCTEHASID
jgi:hypothetical protein